MPPTQPSAQYYEGKLGEEITPAMARSFDYQPHPTVAVPDPAVSMPKTGVFAGLADANDDKKEALRQAAGAPQDPEAGSAKRKMGSGLGSQRGSGDNDDLVMLVVNAKGDLEHVTLSQFVAAIFTDEIKMFHDYQPDQAERFRALRAELSSFVGSDRDIKESKHFREHMRGEIKTMRETWPAIVRTQEALPPLDVRNFSANSFIEGSPLDRFYDAIGTCLQHAGQILSDPVRPTSMSGGAKAESSQIKRGRRRRAT